jgi:hypothetical protein
VIQTISNNKFASLTRTFNPLQATKSTSKEPDFDSFIKAETSFSTVPDAYSNKAEEPISPSDEKYLGIESDGITTLRFPADNAPLAVKKAWIEAMKSLTPDERMMAKTVILQAIIASQMGNYGFGQSFALHVVNAQNYLANISSYQDLFRTSIAENKNAMVGGAGLDAGDQEARQHMIKISQSVLDVFSKNNVK